MSNNDPLAPALGAPDPRTPSRHRPRRTLGGALATVSLFVGLLLATMAPAAVVVGLLLAVTIGGVTGFAVGSRRRSERPLRLCLPRTGVCLRL